LRKGAGILQYTIKAMATDDWERVSHIYQQGIETNLATFQTVCPAWNEFDNSHDKDCRYVILREGCQQWRSF